LRRREIREFRAKKQEKRNEIHEEELKPVRSQPRQNFGAGFMLAQQSLSRPDIYRDIGIRGIS
jgi:hypothetical protein